MGRIDEHLKILKEKPELSTRLEKEVVDLQAISQLVQSSFPKAAFNEEVYRNLLPLTLLATSGEQGNEDLELAKANAAKLTILFGDTERALHFLKLYEKQNPDRKQLIHDACLFSLPEGEGWNVGLWQALASKHMPERTISRVLPFAEKIESYVKLESQEIVKSIRETLVHDYELILSQEYDEEQEQHSKLVEDKINKSFQSYIKKELNVPLSGKLTGEQIQQLRTRMAALTDDDKAKRILIEEEERRIASDNLKKKRGNISPNRSKQEWVAEQLEKRKNIIEANVKSKADNILSIHTAPEIIFGYVKKLGYKRAAENPEAAELFFQYGLSESQFDKYLELKPADSAEHIPDVGLIRLEAYPGYYLQKLDPKDPRAAILGKLTSCCQHLGGAGESSAIHGICDPRGGFYVLCKQLSIDGPNKQDPILSQCWAWRSEQNNIVFDSIESQVNFKAKSPELIDNYFKKLADKLVWEHQVKRVLLGQGGGTPINLAYQAPLFSDQPVNYEGYSDAKRQKILADELFKIYSEVRNDPNRDRQKHLELVKEWCAICAFNESSEHTLTSILTSLAPAEFNIAQAIEDNKKFRLAITAGNFPRIRSLVQNNPYIKAETVALDLVGNRPFRPEILIFLLENGASHDFRKKGDSHYTPLLHRAIDAIENAKSKVAEENKEINEHKEESNEDKLSFLRYLLEEQNVDVNVRDVYGRTPLLRAIESSQYDVAIYLLELGANVNAVDKSGYSPLASAARRGNLDFVKYLVNIWGAEINPQELDPFKNIKIQPPLVAAAGNGEFEIVKYFVENGADIRARDPEGETALLSLFGSGSFGPNHWKLALYLLEEEHFKADVRNDRQFTALHLLARHSSNGWENNQRFIEHLARTVVEHHSQKEAKTDKEKRDFIDAKSDIGETAFFAACKKGYLNMAKLFIQLDADPYAVDDKGNTALHLAIQTDNLVLVKYLVEEVKFRIDLKNSEEKTAPELAVSENKEEIAAYFKELQATRSQQDVATLTKVGTFSHKKEKDSASSSTPTPPEPESP